MLRCFVALQVLLVGMASCNLEWGVLQHEVCQALALEFVATPQPNAAAVLRLVWPKSNNSVLRAMLALYDQDNKRLDRVLEVCLEIGVLNAVLDSTPFPFAIELASLAAAGGVINLEKWLQEQTTYHSFRFLAVSNQFLPYFVATLSITTRPISQAEQSFCINQAHSFEHCLSSSSDDAAPRQELHGLSCRQSSNLLPPSCRASLISLRRVELVA